MPRHHALHHYRPAVGPATRLFLSCYPSHQSPSLSDIQELAGKVRLRTTDDDIALLVRNPPPPPPDAPRSVGRVACLLNDEPIHIYVPLFMRPRIMQT